MLVTHYHRGFWSPSRSLFSQSRPHALGENCRPVCVGMKWRRFSTAGATRPWRLRLEELDRETGQFGFAVPAGVEHIYSVVFYETDGRLVLAVCPNVINTVNGTSVLAELATCVPALTLFVAKY